MTIKQILVERFSVISVKPFDQVIKALETRVGHPNMPDFVKDVASAKTFPEIEAIANRAIGSSGLMEFMRFDLGYVVSTHYGSTTPRSLRFVIGNPVVMKQMLEHVPDAGSYAPVTILVDERPDGVHLSYDTMTSFLTPYHNTQALKVAADLDKKVVTLLSVAAA
jgi:uncharacterized protein (DUF302 family)